MRRKVLPFSPCFLPRSGREIWRRCQRVMESRQADRCEIDLSGQEARQGCATPNWLRVSIAPLADGAVISFVDVSDLRNALIAAEARTGGAIRRDRPTPKA